MVSTQGGDLVILHGLFENGAVARFFVDQSVFSELIGPDDSSDDHGHIIRRSAFQRELDEVVGRLLDRQFRDVFDLCFLHEAVKAVAAQYERVVLLQLDWPADVNFDDLCRTLRRGWFSASCAVSSPSRTIVATSE